MNLILFFKFSKLMSAALLCLLLCVNLASCEKDSLPSGVIARVNGEDIYLHSLQMLMDSRSGSLGTARGPSLENMQKNYINALGILVAQTLARQELIQRGINIEDQDYVNFRKKIDDDFNGDNLDEVLASASLRKDDWEELVKNTHVMEIFRERILKPSIRIGLEEIKHYYDEHKKDFQLPELYSFCFASTSNKGNLEEWCAKKENWLNSPDFRIQCLESSVNELPENLNVLKKLQAGKCAPLNEVEGQWQGMKLLKKIPPRQVAPVEAYAIIENILQVEKQNEALEKWLERRVAASSIQVAPELNKAFAKYASEIADDGASSH